MPRARCPMCKAELPSNALAESTPFCSARCKLLDLGRWLEGSYAIHEPLAEYALPDDPNAFPGPGGEA